MDSMRNIGVVLAATCLCIVAQTAQGQPCFIERVQASEPYGGASFGFAVATTGAQAFIGEPSVIPSATGKAYVFEDFASSWLQLEVLVPSDAMPGMRFGRDVAIRDQLLVEAMASIYVYQHANRTWEGIQKLVAWDDGQLGIGGLAIWDDRIVAGVRGDTTHGNLAGAAYIFRRERDLWVPEQKLYASDAQKSHQFGHGVAIQDHLIAIGAPWDSDSCQPNEPDDCRAGAVYIFHFDERAGHWIENQKIHPPPLDLTVVNLNFGFDVALDGETLLVGADALSLQGQPCGTPSGCGIAFIYTLDRSTGLWNHAQTLMPEQFGVNRFGSRVAIDDGRAVIGAWNSFGPNFNKPFRGAAFLYSRHENGEWLPEAMFLPHPFPGSQNFGWSVDFASNTIVVGTNLESNQQGAAYFFRADAPGDLNCDGIVGVDDLLLLLQGWGECPEPELLHTEWMTCPADLNKDGEVGVADLLILLANWE